MDSRKLITGLAIAALLTVAVTTAGCATNTSPSPTVSSTLTVNGNNTTFSSSTGFNITYPTSLKIDSTSNASEPAKLYIYLTTSNNVTAVTVATQSIDRNATLKDWTNYNKGMLVAHGYENYTVISNQSTTLADQPAYNMVWQATVPVQLSATTTQNMTLEVNQTFLINNDGTGYVLTFKATPTQYDTYLAQAEQIMNSFELT